MSDHPASSSKLGKRRNNEGREEGSGGGGRVRVYLQVVTDAQAHRLANTGTSQPLNKVKSKTGADIEFDSDPSPVPDMKMLIIRGVPSQIEAAIKLITQMIGAEGPISSQVQTFWLKWVEAAFPDLDSRAYFLPPVYFNRVSMTRQSVAGQDVLVLQSETGLAGQSKRRGVVPSGCQGSTPPCVQDSDIREDAALQRVVMCLEKMSKQNKEVFFGMSHLQFRRYLGEPYYFAAANQLPLFSNLPPHLPSNWKEGVFSALLIHRHYGVCIFEVKSLCENKMSHQDIGNTIRKKLKLAVSLLDKAEAMLSHLVSDIAPGLRITKTIAFPNLTAHQVQQAIADNNELNKDLCRCLGTRDPADIAGLCLCSDQLSDPKTPWDLSSHVMRELGHWWQRRVAGAGPDSHMTSGVYKTLVARFCGPATTVSVPCTCPPRVSVKTLGQAVWCTGECYTAVITLFPEQLHLLNTAPPTLFVTGPPGTGKTVVLLLMAIKWLQCGHHVYILCTGWWSRAAFNMLYHLLLQTVNTQQLAGVSSGQLQPLQYDFEDGKDVNKALNDLSHAAMEGPVYVIADESRHDNTSRCFQTFCEELKKKVSRLHLWAASCFHGDLPEGWQVEYLTRPLRSPPAVVREVKQAKEIEKGDVQPYSERGVPDHTDGPPVKRLYHRGQGHSCPRLVNCVTCGQVVASFLKSLKDDVSGKDATTSTASNTGAQPNLRWKDMLVLYWGDVSDKTGFVQGMNEAVTPVRTMTMKDEDIEDVAKASSDVVWVANGDRVRGLERKVVVCLDPPVESSRLYFMSRCTSQLVIVSLETPAKIGKSHTV